VARPFVLAVEAEDGGAERTDQLLELGAGKPLAGSPYEVESAARG
jgi:hypothetical protein